MIETRHILHVLAIADHCHFGRAAESVHLTQPALTQSVQVVERRLGVRLFDRSRRGVELTSYGRLFVERGERALAEIRELETEIALRKGLASGSLAIGMAPYPGAMSGQAGIARLLAEYPGISCRVQVGDWRQVTRDVLRGSTDLGIADLGDAAGHSEFDVERLSARPLSFVCRPGHALLSKPRLTIGDLAEHPWVSTRAPSRMREFLPDPPGRAGRWDGRSGDFIPAIETDVMTDFAVLARESDALVVAGLTMVADDLEQGRIVALPYSAPWFRFNYGWIRRRGRTLPPAAADFMKFVREIELDLDEREAALRKKYLP